MARIPVYGPRITPSGVIRTAPQVAALDLSGLARGAQQLAIDLEQESAFQAQQREAADKAEARSQMLSLQDELADAFEAHTAGVLDGTVDKTSARTKWAEATRPMIDSAVEKIPPSQRQLVAGQLKLATGNLERKLDRVVAAKDRKDIAGAIDQTLEYAARMSQTDYAGARHLAMQTLMELGPFAGLDAAAVQKKANAWREEAAYTRALGVLSGSKRDNKALAKAEQVIAGMEDIDPRRKVELQGQIEGYRAANEQRALAAAQRAEVEAQRRERKAATAWNMVSTWVANGKVPDEATMQQVTKAVSGTDYAKALPELLKQVPAQAAVAMLPVHQQQAELDQLRARAVQGTNEGLEREIKRREQVLTSTRADYKADPIGADIERGLAQPVELDFSKPETMQARAEQARRAQLRAGHPVGMLRPHEAEHLTQYMEKMAPREKEALVQSIYTAAGPDVGRATFAQISPHAPLLSVAAGLAGFKTTGKEGEGPQRSVSQLIFRGEELLKTKAVNIPGGDKPEQSPLIEEQFTKYAGSAIPNPRARMYAAQATAMVYATLMHEAGRVNDKGVNASIFRQAASMVTGGVIDHNGAKVLPPAYGLPANKSRDLLRGVTADQVKAWGGVAGMTDEDAAAFLRRAPLESLSYGRYRVPSGAGMLLRPDGTPFEMVFR